MRIKYEFVYNEDDYEADLEVSPSTRDVFYLRNGDPGYPGDPLEIEIIRLVKLPDKEITVASEIEFFTNFLYECHGSEIDAQAKEEPWPD